MSRPPTKTAATLVAMMDSPARMAICACVVAGAFGMLEFGILTLLADLNVSRLSLRIQTSVVTGVVSGAFVWAFLTVVSLGRRHLETKLKVVADLNHVLRNALEIIANSGYLPQDQRHAALLERRTNKQALEELVIEARAIRQVIPDHRRKHQS